MNNNMGFNNKAWGRSNDSPNMLNQRSIPPQLMNQGTLGNMGSTMVQFPSNQQVFQNMGLQGQNLGLGLQQIANNAMNAAASLNPQIANNPLFQQVSYPNTRGLNPTAFQANIPSLPSTQNNSGSGTKQRVFTGKVTQMHDNFGLVDEEVIFQTNVCVKGSHPIVGDRVLVEASYTPTMHFKWSATRVQVLSAVLPRHPNKNYGNSGNYNAVPPPEGRDNRKGGGGGGGGNRGRERPRDRDREEDEIDRKRRREERMREREKEDKKSPVRKRTRSRSRSPKNRRRLRVVPRYNVQIPKIALDLYEADVLEIRRRYNNIYVPSDFFNTSIRWVDSFPPDKPFALNKSCSFHVMHKDVDAIAENDAVLDPPDADYLFSAKVMLMSVPGIDEIYQRCCAMAEDRDGTERDYVHPSRLVNFLVGLRGKNETMAIGGPWSASLDGERPDADPSVLIKTAIRTCKGLTGIDLSNCTQWYRFVELNYRRGESTHKGRTVPARVETVVVFLPDVWSCLPTRLEWDGLQAAYRRRLDDLLDCGDWQESGSEHAADADEKDEDASAEKLEPTPFALLDVKSMSVSDLRNELRARSISPKGLKSQLVARLAKALKVEAEQGDKGQPVGEKKESDNVEAEADKQEDKKSEVEEKKLDDRERALLEKRHTLPERPHIVVHPSKTAKSGKFDCTVMSLSLLLDYRPEDTKEHSFEVSLFAELFNEMLIRDFGFNIYKALQQLPEKKDEKKEKEEKKEENGDKDKEEAVVEGDKEKEKGVEEASKKRGPKRDEDTDEEDDDSDEDSGRRGGRNKDKAAGRRKERSRRYTKDRHLLLSFVYFDQTHCGYIFDKDIEDLLFTLGLKLSRAQVKKLVSKVVTRDSLHYRKLTDKPKEEETADAEESPEDVEEEERTRKLAQGNRWMLPVFKGGAGSDAGQAATRDDGPEAMQDGFVKYKGSLVDINKLMLQLERSEKTRLETEARMVDLKHDNHKLSDKYAKSNSTIKHLSSELKDFKDKLRNTEETLNKTAAHSKLYQQTLFDMRDKIDPVLKSTIQKEEPSTNHFKKEKDEKDKSRWEGKGSRDGSVKKETEGEEEEEMEQGGSDKEELKTERNS